MTNVLDKQSQREQMLRKWVKAAGGGDEVDEMSSPAFDAVTTLTRTTLEKIIGPDFLKKSR